MAFACSDHKVSPWPGEGPEALLAPYVASPDLDAQLAKIDAETRAHGLTLRAELKRTLPRRGGPVVLRAYQGTDALGRPTHAVRVATARGVVMAIGPLEPRDPRDLATELVAGLAGGSGEAAAAFTSGTDLDGDGLLDVVLRNEAGGLEIWRLTSTDSNRYEVELAMPPTRGVDADGDGRIDLAGRLEAPAGDPIAPRFEDVAMFHDGKWTDAAPSAKAWHARRAAARAEPVAGTDADAGTHADAGTGTDAGTHAGTGTGTDAGTRTDAGTDAGTRADAGTGTAAGAGAAAEPDAIRLRRLLERAWHRLLAGEPRASVIADLDKISVPVPLRESFEKHRRRIVAIQKTW